MQQNKLESFVETCLNVAIGFAVSYSMWPLVCVYLGVEYHATENLAVTCFFTVLSIARGYVVRRWFNRGLHKTAGRIVAGLMRDR